MKTETALPITEQENPRSKDLSSQSTAEIVALMNDEDATVSSAVKRVLSDVVKAVDEIVARLSKGGRLFYTGTGTSGRLGVLDASECPPTFGVSPELVQGLIAGGYDACHKAVEASEDVHGAAPAPPATGRWSRPRTTTPRAAATSRRAGSPTGTRSSASRPRAGPPT